MTAIRTIVAATILLGCFTLMSRAQAPTSQPAGLTGTWKWTQGFGGNDVEFTLKLKQDGQKLTGTLSGFNNEDSPIQDGTVAADGTFTFKITRDFNGQQVVTTYTGKRTGDGLKGKSETVFARDFDAKKSEG